MIYKASKGTERTSYTAFVLVLQTSCGSTTNKTPANFQDQLASEAEFASLSLTWSHNPEGKFSCDWDHILYNKNKLHVCN